MLTFPEQGEHLAETWDNAGNAFRDEVTMSGLA